MDHGRTKQFAIVVLLLLLSVSCTQSSNGGASINQPLDNKESASLDKDNSNESKDKTPSVLVDKSRYPALTNEYLRISFLSDPKLVPTTVARFDAIRALFTSSRLFEPPIPLEDVADYLGLEVQESQNLAIYDCRPQDSTIAVLATWPNVINLLQDDLGASYSCPPKNKAPENDVFCIAESYFDAPEQSITRTLMHTLDVAGEFFDPTFPERANVLQRIYGISPAFSGLGYEVRGSEIGLTFFARKSLRNLIVSEFLLPNRPLAELGCACIVVPPYTGRSQDLLDLNFVFERGSSTCVKVDKLFVSLSNNK